MMTEYNRGDYVVYTVKGEVGRVAKVYDGACFVCYHAGCTSARTSDDLLRPATDDEVAGAMPGLGYHRFDECGCPEYDECHASGFDFPDCRPRD